MFNSMSGEKLKRLNFELGAKERRKAFLFKRFYSFYTQTDLHSHQNEKTSVLRQSDGDENARAELE